MLTFALYSDPEGNNVFRNRKGSMIVGPKLWPGQHEAMTEIIAGTYVCMYSLK